MGDGRKKEGKSLSQKKKGRGGKKKEETLFPFS